MENLLFYMDEGNKKWGQEQTNGSSVTNYFSWFFSSIFSHFYGPHSVTPHWLVHSQSILLPFLPISLTIFPCMAYFSILKKMAASSFKTLVPTYQTTWHHNSEHNNLHSHCSKNHKAHTVTVHLVTLKQHNYRQGHQTQYSL
jgi:hypothetical protein